VKLLLDSHAYLWWLADDPALGAEALAAIADPAHSVIVSAATIWELEIKRRLGRLDVGGADLVAEIGENGFLELPVTGAHARDAAALPRHHADPFDRMLVAQCVAQGAHCVTRDPIFRAYGVPCLW